MFWCAGNLFAQSYFYPFWRKPVALGVSREVFRLRMLTSFKRASKALSCPVVNQGKSSKNNANSEVFYGGIEYNNMIGCYSHHKFRVRVVNGLNLAYV